MPNNLQNPTNLDIQPAQMVGGMRVKQPDNNRTPLRAENVDKREANEDEHEVAHGDQFDEEMERERIRALQDRQAHDMQAHAASRQPDITRNAGSNVKQIFVTPTQPRSMNH